MSRPALDRETDRRWAAILAWLLAGTIFALILSGLGRLKYLQDILWPTAIYTYQHGTPGGEEVALVGSSRSSFGLAPSAIDPCLEARLGRPLRSVNLSRVYASILTERILVRDLLEAAPPQVLVVEVAPEILNDRHYEFGLNMAWNAGWQDTPTCLRGARGPGDLADCGRPLFRGVENLARLLDGGYRDDDHLSWMMLFHGGGQFCFNAPGCAQHNADYTESLSGRWQARVDKRLASIPEERFADYRVGEGAAHTYLLDLIQWAAANQVSLRLVNLPVHTLYQAQIPPRDQAAFVDYLDGITRSYGVPWYDANTADWNTSEGIWIDPDHLNPTGAQRLSQQICEDVIIPAMMARGQP